MKSMTMQITVQLKHLNLEGISSKKLAYNVHVH